MLFLYLQNQLGNILYFFIIIILFLTHSHHDEVIFAIKQTGWGDCGSMSNKAVAVFLSASICIDLF